MCHMSLWRRVSQAEGTEKGKCSEVLVYVACPRTHLEACVIGKEQEKEQREEIRGWFWGRIMEALEAIKHLSRRWA